MKRSESATREFFEAHISPDLPHIRDRIEKRFEDKAEEAKKETLDIFASLCDRARAMQKEGLLGNVAMINLSFLRIGLAEGKGLYRADVCDKDWPAMKTPCFALWDAKFAFDPYFECVRAWKERVRAFPGVREVDVDVHASELTVFPRFVADAFLAAAGPLFAKHPSYAALSKEDGCGITLGEYRDAQTDISGIHRETQAG
jgi:hypothetical protein